MAAPIVHSSQDFVRSLKSSLDPPVPGGPSKIQIAEKAWLDDSFYLPSKGEVILEWLLTRFLKEKDKGIAVNPILDVQYWSLVRSICCETKQSEYASNYRNIKIWLAPLLHRIPLIPVVVSFLRFLPSLSRQVTQELIGLVNSSLFTLWPILVQRTTAENLLDCFGALLPTLSLEGDTHNLGRLIISSYLNSLSNSSNKKKLCQTFLQTHLHQWVRVLSHLDTVGAHIRTHVLSAGVETIFNLDILRQQRASDFKIEFSLIEGLMSFSEIAVEDQILVLNILPQIFSQYVQALTKHRGALYSQGSQSQPGVLLEEVRQASMSFFSSAMARVGENQDAPSWTARLAFLRVIDAANVYQSQQPDSRNAFDTLTETAWLGLRECWDDSFAERTSLIFQCLSMIIKIDYDRATPTFSRFLPRLFQTSRPSEPHFTFLDLLLEYQSKTRTVNVLIQELFDSLSSTSAPSGLIPPELAPDLQYQVALSSPLMHSRFLDNLGKAVLNFMTESQCLSIVTQTLQVVQVTSTRVFNTSLSPSKKKPNFRASDANAMDVDYEDVSHRQGNPATASGICYCLTTRLASVILSSLPIRTLSSKTLVQLRKVIGEFQKGFIKHEISRALKAMKKQDAGDRDITLCWTEEICLTATLRLFYALHVSRNLALENFDTEKLHSKLAQFLKRDLTGLSPELVVEVFRVLLHNVSKRESEDTSHEDVFEKLIEYTQQITLPKNTEVHWTGHNPHLVRPVESSPKEDVRASAALAILAMLFERWLPDVNQYASQEQIRKLLMLLVEVGTNSSHSSTSTSPSIQTINLLLQTLHSAEFWEYKNIRTVFLNVVSEATNLQTQDKLLGVFRLLLLFPVEYFATTVLSGLNEAALRADFELSTCNKHNGAQYLTLTRTFLKNTLSRTGRVGSVVSCEGIDQADLILHFLKEPPTLAVHTMPAGVRESFFTATLDLIEVYVLWLLKGSKKESSAESDKFWKTVNTQLSSRNGWNTDFNLWPKFLGRLVELLSREVPHSSVGSTTIEALRSIHSSLFAILLPQVEALTSTENPFSPTTTLQAQAVELVKEWYNMLCLGRWLGYGSTGGATNVNSVMVSQKLIPILSISLKHSADKTETIGLAHEFSTTVFAILLKELDQKSASERRKHLDAVVALYLFVTGFAGFPSHKELNSHLAQDLRKMEVADYIHVLELVVESLRGESSRFDTENSEQRLTRQARVLSLTKLASVLLREHPSHSSIHSQKFLAGCLRIFTGFRAFVVGPIELRREVLEMVATCCSDQQTLLRVSEVQDIFLLLSQHLFPMGSDSRDTQTYTFHFHLITSILSSLVRLRRDLVSLCLPHTGLILRKLIGCLRTPRPNLGAKQGEEVMSAMPRWVVVDRPLGVSEARALVRVLEGLVVKTVVRGIASSTQQQQPKAESLSKPFSKHASYVLQAYIEVLNDPLVVVPSDIRKELRPGLFALCAMINDHSRDALMVGGGLTEGGKAILKEIWKEWEKVKYVGKG